MTLSPVIIPSEIQTREFDAKLLLACFLAESGVDVYVGARHEIHANIHHLPPSIYVAKDFRDTSVQIFNILSLLGHRIVAWDEEGLITHEPELYYRRRVAEKAISKVQEFYAWGENNKALIENAPGFPATNIHTTGNPRGDLLRPEFKDFYADTIERLQARYGNFILINSNFGFVNHKVRSLKVSPETSGFSNGHGPVPEIDQFLRHRQSMLDTFIDLLPDIARRFPGNTIVVRPHPSENHSLWTAAAAKLKNIEIIHEGPVLPWLLAAGTMIHNGCTTGLEAFLLGRPAISFEPKDVHPGAENLPNFLSNRAQSQQELFALISQCLDTNQPLPQTDAQWKEISRFIGATNGPFASEQIAQHIRELNQRDCSSPISSSLSRFSGGVLSRLRKVEKKILYMWPEHKSSRAYNTHRYPGLKQDEVQSRVASFAKITGKFGTLSVDHCREQIFLIANSRRPKF